MKNKREMNSVKKYNEEEEEYPQKIAVESSCMELQEFIFQLEDNVPDKRTKLYKEWLEDINSAMMEYNRRFGKMFNLIK